MPALLLSALIYICALAFVSVSAKAGASEGAEQIRAIENKSGGRIGIGAIDTKNNQRIEYRPNERFPMCSTFKLLAVGAVLQRVDHGKEKLDRFIPYREKDLLEYAPVTRQHVQEGGMKLEPLCAAAIEQSDGTAANLLLQTIGGPGGITQFARSIGDEVTRLDRMEPELNRWTPGDERDTTTPAMMCEDLRRLLETDLLSKESRRLLDDWLQRCQTGLALIRAGVPTGWRVGDKTGRSGNGAINDVAVIYPPDGAPIFIAIYTFSASATDEQRSSAIASVARIVCQTFRPEGAR